jgi:acetolactate synthase I/II/III large subunit
MADNTGSFTGSGAVTGGGALVQALIGHQVDTVFGLPGAQIYGLFDALAQAQGSIRTIGARHEQGVAYMAYGYARASGRPGVYTVVPGPGILNTGAALLTAYGANAPVLCLTGQVTSDYLGRERGQLHELRDQLGVLRALTKWAERIEHPTQAPLLVARAFQEMLSGRQGPVALEAPWDFFTRLAHAEGLPPLPLFPTPEPDPDQIKAAARALGMARAPMIFVGGGALGASAAITELAEALAAPVMSFRAGRGIVSDAHPMGLTVASGARLWPQCDVALAIGTRFEVPDMRWHHRPRDLKIIRIDIDPAEMRRLPAAIGIVADADRAVRALLPELSRQGVRARDRAGEVAEAKRATALAIQKVQPQVDYLKVIRDVLPPNGFFVDELSQIGFASWFAFPVYEPRTFVSSGYQGTLGFGFPTALGVKIAFPDRAVVSITGDGGFMFGVQELATAVQYGINLVTVIFNNESYGNVRRDQQEAFAGRLIGADLINPDFIKLAESFGVTGRRVTSPEQLRPALEEALAAGAPRVIEVMTRRGSEVSPWEFLHPKLS